MPAIEAINSLNHPETIAIIPARGGSKGIPRKNITNLAGKPLIAYSILAAKHSKLIDRVIVSTEDEEIAEVAKDWGAEVPFLRPKELATDTSNIGDAISYTVSKLENTSQKRALVQLYPTSPFRTAAFIDEMVGMLFSGYSSVTTVKKVHFDPQFLYVQDKEKNELINICGETQMIPGWKQYFRQYSILMANLPQKPEKHYYHVLTDKCMLIDIDTPADLQWAEVIIRKNLFEFGF